MPSLSYILPFRERTRLSARACAAQKYGPGDLCGFLISNEEGRLALWFLDKQNINSRQWTLEERDIKEVWNAVHRHGMKVVGTFHSHPVSQPIPIAGDLGSMPWESLQLFYDVHSHEVRLWRITSFRDQRVSAEVPLVTEQMPSDHRHEERDSDWRFEA